MKLNKDLYNSTYDFYIRYRLDVISDISYHCRLLILHQLDYADFGLMVKLIRDDMIGERR